MNHKRKLEIIEKLEQKEKENRLKTEFENEKQRRHELELEKLRNKQIMTRN
jgi:hypothetical protein